MLLYGCLYCVVALLPFYIDVVWIRLSEKECGGAAGGDGKWAVSVRGWCVLVVIA